MGDNFDDKVKTWKSELVKNQLISEMLGIVDEYVKARDQKQSKSQKDFKRLMSALYLSRFQNHHLMFQTQNTVSTRVNLQIVTYQIWKTFLMIM